MKTYWTNPTHEALTHYWVYRDYGACTVMDESGPSLILYFNRGTNLYKQLMTPKYVDARFFLNVVIIIIITVRVIVIISMCVF
ncbi:unnamed protein product [Trichobilharzia regenti]|nr:unnamed protein product [Trichobilharzia regenti]